MKRFVVSVAWPPQAEKGLISKFGDDYGRYMHRVPRVNFVAGIFRLLRHGKMDDKRR
jgi:hypothetical protein